MSEFIKIIASFLFLLLLHASIATSQSNPSSGGAKPANTKPTVKKSNSPVPSKNATPPPPSPAVKNFNSPVPSKNATPPPPNPVVKKSNSPVPSKNATPPPPSPSQKRRQKLKTLKIKPFIPEFNWEQQQYLKSHNDLRQKSGSPPLQWDANLTSYSNSWAVQRQEDCNYRNHSKGKYGESSFWMQYKDFSPNDVVEHWFSEVKLYDHNKNVCKCKVEMDGCECGHYLNIVWKTTKRIGCSGYVHCKNQKGILVFCSYDPPGNYKGVNPFQATNLRGSSGGFSTMSDPPPAIPKGIQKRGVFRIA